jgi:hypothetical protein
MYAKLLPLEKGILNFACRANHHLYNYDSRVDNAPSYQEIYEPLKTLAKYDLAKIHKLTSNSNWTWILHFDNVQHYVCPRNFRIGRELAMNIGTAATIFEFKAFTTSALSMEDKKKQLAENK